jgi:glutathione peroxidase
MKLDDIPITTMEGTTTSLAEFAGTVKLIVNVASRCGLAPQYEQLEQLQREYGDRGLTVLGFPSNQFLQELGDNDAIRQYCSMTWGITFPIFDRVRVNGRHEHPLYTELKKTPDAEGKAGRVSWNFEKFLVTSSGEVRRFRPRTEPKDPAVIAAIEAALPAGSVDAARKKGVTRSGGMLPLPTRIGDL